MEELVAVYRHPSLMASCAPGEKPMNLVSTTSESQGRHHLVAKDSKTTGPNDKAP
ncbi:hypothetical protein RBSWK_00608 [Rhodopirellula baltica SWK14]|uniref:Uncharacterized protein n=1 Tax=Rhodopirellula baltica SWK14 TaxID=993516 RepID=L7CNS9_RHOBT|nr:hypothetical protein RBSWK_00608 [Rhodopirellula baltica SWK14]